MTVTLNLKPEIEESLETQARARGLSIADYLQECIDRLVRSTSQASKPADKLKLPALALGNLGSLHRRDIYDDAP